MIKYFFGDKFEEIEIKKEGVILRVESLRGSSGCWGFCGGCDDLFGCGRR